MDNLLNPLSPLHSLHPLNQRLVALILVGIIVKQIMRKKQ